MSFISDYHSVSKYLPPVFCYCSIIVKVIGKQQKGLTYATWNGHKWIRIDGTDLPDRYKVISWRFERSFL